MKVTRHMTPMNSFGGKHSWKGHKNDVSLKNENYFINIKKKIRMYI